MAVDPSAAIGIGILVIWGILALVALFISVFWIIALIDAARREFPGPYDKVMWVLVIVFSHGVGALIYWLVGRPSGCLPGERPHMT